MNATSHSPEPTRDRVEAVLAHVAEALADTAETSEGGGPWTARWDAIGPAQPHDPITAAPYAGLNRLLLTAGAAAVADAETGAWATDVAWYSAGFRIIAGQQGVIALRDTTSGLKAVTVFNACQVTGAPAPLERFAAPPPFTNDQIDRLFGVDDGQPRSTLEPTDRRASQLSAAAVARAGARAGYEIGWADPKRSLAGVLGSLMVANTLGFSYHPEMPPPPAAQAWADRLRSPDGGRMALEVSADASRLAAIVVERIATRQIDSLGDVSADRPDGVAFSHNGMR